MDLYGESHNAKAWMCKSMQNIQWADEINSYFDKPKYIYLYRDPRDVTLSFTKAVIGDKHPYFIAKQWNKLQELCISQLNKEENNTVFPISYEKLLEILTSNAMKPSQNLILDLPAAMILRRSSLTAFFLNGHDLENFKAAVQGMQFRGTVVRPEASEVLEGEEEPVPRPKRRRTARRRPAKRKASKGRKKTAAIEEDEELDPDKIRF